MTLASEWLLSWMQYSHQQPRSSPTIPFFWRLMSANPKFSPNLISPLSVPHSKQWWKPWAPKGRRQASLSVIPTHQPYSEETAIELTYLHINDPPSLYFLLYLTPLFSTGSQGSLIKAPCLNQYYPQLHIPLMSPARWCYTKPERSPRAYSREPVTDSAGCCFSFSQNIHLITRPESHRRLNSNTPVWSLWGWALCLLAPVLSYSPSVTNDSGSQPPLQVLETS